jgi:ethanolamine permease
MSTPRPRGASGVTYTSAEAGYFDKRGLTRTAGFWGLWGLGVAAVISGDFSGWNFGIGGADGAVDVQDVEPEERSRTT